MEYQITFISHVVQGVKKECLIYETTLLSITNIEKCILWICLNLITMLRVGMDL